MTSPDPILDSSGSSTALSTGASAGNGPPRLRLNGQQGATIILAIVVVALLMFGLGTYLENLGNNRHLQEQRLLDDRALMAAEGGLAMETGTLEGAVSPPASDKTQVFTLPAAQFAPFENVSVTVHVQTSGSNGQKYFTIVSTAVGDQTLTREHALSRRVQVTLSQENFAKYELFVNNFGSVYSSGAIRGYGLGSILMGPVNINSGMGIFPNFWSLGLITSAASGGVNIYPDYASYVAGVGSNGNAANCVNIMQYYSSTYATAPQFLGGLTILPSPISLPANMGTDTRAQQLVANAGMTLPGDYANYNSAAGPNFEVDLADPDNQSGNGNVTVKQYLGTVNGVPSFGPSMVRSLSQVNNAIVVQGNVVSLSGTLNGNLSIAALAPASFPSGGNVNITGNLVYKSVAANPQFQYPDSSQLQNSDGSINTSYVNTLQAQLKSVTDTLGIVAEGNVLVKQSDLYGSPIAADSSHPIYVDAVIMATGASTSTPGDGSFGPENYGTRPPGQCYFLGGVIENAATNWKTSNGNGIVNGLNKTEFWDQRMSQIGGAPPFFPTTGNFTVTPYSWVSTYVQDASTPPVYPSLN